MSYSPEDEHARNHLRYFRYIRKDLKYAAMAPELEDIRAVNPALIDKVLEIIPMGRAATEEEVASMVAYLATRDAGFVTGQVISVNGGATML